MSNPNFPSQPPPNNDFVAGLKYTATILGVMVTFSAAAAALFNLNSRYPLFPVDADSVKQPNGAVLTSSLIDTMSDDEIIEKIQDLDTNWVQTLTSEEQKRVAERLLDRIPHLQSIENIELRDKILAVMHQGIDSESPEGNHK